MADGVEESSASIIYGQLFIQLLPFHMISQGLKSIFSITQGRLCWKNGHLVIHFQWVLHELKSTQPQIVPGFYIVVSKKDVSQFMVFFLKVASNNYIDQECKVNIVHYGRSYGVVIVLFDLVFGDSFAFVLCKVFTVKFCELWLHVLLAVLKSKLMLATDKKDKDRCIRIAVSRVIIANLCLELNFLIVLYARSRPVFNCKQDLGFCLIFRIKPKVAKEFLFERWRKNSCKFDVSFDFSLPGH